MAKLVARPFATAGVGTNPGISQNKQNGRHKQRNGQKKNTQNKKRGRGESGWKSYSSCNSSATLVIACVHDSILVSL